MNLTEFQKLKYWLDAEFAVIHILFGLVLLQLTDWWVWEIVLVIYIIYNIAYGVLRAAVIATSDPNYLRIPKR